MLRRNHRDWLLGKTDEAARILEEAGIDAVILEMRRRRQKNCKHILLKFEERMAWLIARLSAMVETQEDLLGLRHKIISRYRRPHPENEISETEIEPIVSVAVVNDITSEAVNVSEAEEEALIPKLENPRSLWKKKKSKLKMLKRLKRKIR